MKRIGRWIDFDTGYRTMDASFMESVWWVFKQLWDKGLVYRGYKVLHIGRRFRGRSRIEMRPGSCSTSVLGDRVQSQRAGELVTSLQAAVGHGLRLQGASGGC